MRDVRRTCQMIVFALIALCCTGLLPTASAVDARRGELSKPDGVADENAIYLENQYLRVGITTNEYAGQIMELIYKPTGQDLCPEKHFQGYAMPRMGDDRFFWKQDSRDFSGRIVSQAAEKAVAEVSFTWNYDYYGKQTTIEVITRYELQAGASNIHFAWRLENVGEQAARMVPWVKHVGGRRGELLSGPRRMLAESGPIDPGGAFTDAWTNWVARLSGKLNTEKHPMVASLFEYEKILQHFPWGGKQRFSLETIFGKITIAPGESWSTDHVLAVMPNLGDVSYVVPELAASIEREETGLEAGKRGRVTVHLSPAVDLGEKRLEGAVYALEGGMVEKLPNRQVTLEPGKISSLTYEVSPPENGAYYLSLTVFDEQQILRLGQSVNGQQSSITLPFSVGPKPEKLVSKWETEATGWPRREEAVLKPWRTLLLSDGLKVGQVQVPDRVYPEHVVEFDDSVEPARISAARGEYENLQFLVRFDRPEDVMDLTISATSLKTDGGGEIPIDAVREAIYLTTDTPSGYKDFPIGQWPDPLLDFGWHEDMAGAEITRENVEVLEDSQKRVVWVGVKVPREAPAGLYRGGIELSLGGDEVGRFPLELKVHDFALPGRPSYRPSTGMVGFKSGASNWLAIGLSEEDFGALKREGKVGVDAFWKMALERGWTPTMFGGLSRWKKFHDHGRGITTFATGGGGEAEEWLKENDLLQYSFKYAPFDEHSQVEIPEVVEWCREFKEKSDVPILDCYYGGGTEPLHGLVDIWLGQDPTQEWAQERREKGDLFFSVNSSLIWHVEYEPLSGRAGFWSDFVKGVDGRYVYSSCRWTRDVYEKNWTSGNYMGCAIYPAPDGYATSIRFETMRDGVEDYDYLSLLRRAVTGAKARGADSEALRDAERLLEDADLPARVKDARDLHQERERIANLIERLKD